MRTKKYPYAIFSIDTDSDVVYVECIKNLKVDIAIAKNLVANRLDFTENKKHYLIIDISNVSNISAEAKAYLQDKKAGLKNILGAAFIASNHVSTLLATVFVKTPNAISTLSADKKEAEEWINTLKNNKKSKPRN